MLTKLYEENAAEIVAVPEGVVIVSQEQADDRQAVVTYRFYNFRTKRMMPVTKDVYLRGKFGDGYAAIAVQLPDYINYRVAELSEGRLLCVYPTGESIVFSADGFIEWRGSLTYQDNGPTGVAAFGDDFWLSYAKGDTIVRYRFPTMREELRIGSAKDTAFSRPCGLNSENGRLIVCNQESCCVEAVDVKTFAVEKLFTFNEPVYQFVRSSRERVVLLESGVYQL